MTSFEIIGTIAVLGEDGTKKQAKEILENNKNIKTVAKRTGDVQGKYRIKKVKVILGENTTLTIHKENGVRIKIDINKAYYSPRLQTERQRVMNLVKNDEIIIDMFAGAGPFTIAIAKNRKPEHIYALDYNPSAIKLLKENITLNKLTNITAIKGDALKTIKELPKADRIIMNAPRQNTIDTLKAALKKIKPKGIIHYYTTTEAPDLKDIKKLKGTRITNTRTVIAYAPGKAHLCLDIKKRQAEPSSVSRLKHSTAKVIKTRNKRKK